MFEPIIIDDGQSIAPAEDQINEISIFTIVAERLDDPMRVCALRAVSRPLECGQGCLDMAAANEDVKIFGVPHDAGVVGHRIGAADEEWDVRLFQHLNAGDVELSRLLRQFFENSLRLGLLGCHCDHASPRFGRLF